MFSILLKFQKTVQATALLRRQGGESHCAPLLCTPGPDNIYLGACITHVPHDGLLDVDSMAPVLKTYDSIWNAVVWGGNPGRLEAADGHV